MQLHFPKIVSQMAKILSENFVAVAKKYFRFYLPIWTNKFDLLNCRFKRRLTATICKKYNLNLDL